MQVKVNRTNSGRYYLSVTAETVAEQLELTAMREQMRESKDIVHEFGGASSFNEEVGRPLDTAMNLLVREPEVEPVRGSKKARFLGNILGTL